MSTRNLQLLSRLVALAIAALVLLSACSLPQVTAESRIFLGVSLDFLGEYRLPKTTLADTPVGGLSALAYDRRGGRFYALSDDHSRNAPARFYTLKLVTSTSGEVGLDKVEVKAVTLLKDQKGQVYPPDTIDPEGIALSRHQSIFVSSEGVRQVPPVLAEFDLTGLWQQSLPVPARYWSDDATAPQGIANNLGFESLTLNPEGDRLFTATESALMQDVSADSPVVNRLLHYWVGEPEPFLVSEHGYPLGPVPSGAIAHGLVELTSIDSGGHFLSLERSYSPFGGYSAQIFQVAIGGATDTTKIATLNGRLDRIEPARKRLVLDLSQLGIPLENLEGMALGPRLQDGTQSLLLVSDNNFGAVDTQFLLFRLSRSLLTEGNV